MRQIAQDAHAVHLGDYFLAKPAESPVALVAAGANQVLRVVAHLNDAHA